MRQKLAVLGTGWLLGGTAGLGTILYALAIGPIVGFMLPLFTIEHRNAKVAFAAE